MNFFIAAVATFFGMFIVVPLFLGILRFFGLYAIVQEGTCHVYVLFGKVRAVLTEPGLQFLFMKLGLFAPIVNWLGKRYILDTRLDQTYLRSQAVNSEEGAPMGIGIWYEMWIGDPVAYLFRNADPRGSLAANVSSATVRCLSNLKLGDMLENRHAMSQTVRDEVSPQSAEWGYHLGSIYIRKVHFRDLAMIKQIEEKVVNRLRQVTSAIKQDGTNRVNIIASTAAREAAIEFAKAAAMRPKIVGEALQKIGRDPDVLATMFEILEAQKVIDGKAMITLVPPKSDLMNQLIAAQTSAPKPPGSVQKPPPLK